MHLQSYMINVVDVLKRITEKRVCDRVFYRFFVCRCVSTLQKVFELYVDALSAL